MTEPEILSAVLDKGEPADPYAVRYGGDNTAETAMRVVRDLGPVLDKGERPDER